VLRRRAHGSVHRTAGQLQITLDSIKVQAPPDYRICKCDWRNLQRGNEFRHDLRIERVSLAAQVDAEPPPAARSELPVPGAER
jgi:hypothetical protein